jgi:hypothetical protein
VAEDPYDIEHIEPLPPPPPPTSMLRPTPTVFRPEVLTPTEPDSPQVAEARAKVVRLFTGLAYACVAFAVWMFGVAVFTFLTNPGHDEGVGTSKAIFSIVMGLFFAGVTGSHLILVRLLKDRITKGVEFAVMLSWFEAVVALIAFALSLSPPQWIALIVQAIWLGVMVQLIVNLRVIKHSSVAPHP